MIGAVRQNNMETKLWSVVLTVSVMTSVTTQIDLSSLGMGFGKADKLTTPAPMQHQQQEYQGQGYEQQQQHGGFNKPQKDKFQFQDPLKPFKQELKLDKFDKEKDKFFKQDKLQQKQEQHQQQQYTPISVAAPVEPFGQNPTYSTYIPSMSYAPTIDDGSYSSPYRPQQYQQYNRPQYPQYNGAPGYRGQGYNNANVSAVAFDLYRTMYGYNNKGPARAPAYGQYRTPSAPVYGPPAQYGNGQPQYGAPAQYPNIPYANQGPPMGAPVVVPYEGGYHEEPRPYHGPTNDNYGHQYTQQIDYSKYVAPVPYSEVADYVSPAQYNDYTGMLYSAYNIPTPQPPTPHYPPNNYTAHRTGYNQNGNFKMVVAVVVLDGSHDYKAMGGKKEFGKTTSVSSIQGTLFISEIYPYICLISGVVTGLPPNYKFGVAIHSFGDLSNGCGSIGPHFNPNNKTHGNINAPQSHAGDLGNLRSDAAGVAFVNKISRNQFSIQHRNPVAGRSIGICEKQDDLGLGGNIQSLRDGNCGRILACGIIGLANTGYPASNSGHY